MDSELHKISQIAKRAINQFDEYIGDNNKLEVLDIIMDLEAANEHIPIDFDGLMAADEANFNHDIIGIIRHLNRNTRKLEECFVPRFALANRVDENCRKY